MLVFVYSYVSMALCQFIHLSETSQSCRKTIFWNAFFFVGRIHIEHDVQNHNLSIILTINSLKIIILVV